MSQTGVKKRFMVFLALPYEGYDGPSEAASFDTQDDACVYADEKMKSYYLAEIFDCDERRVVETMGCS